MTIFGYKIEKELSFEPAAPVVALLSSFLCFFLVVTGMNCYLVPVWKLCLFAFLGLAFVFASFRLVYTGITLQKVIPVHEEPVHERKAISGEAILKYSLIKAQKEHDYYTNLFYKEKALLLSNDNVEIVPILCKRLKDIAIKVDAKTEEINRLKSVLHAR